MSIIQSNVHKSVIFVKTENNRLFDTAVGTECQHVGGFMRPWTPETQRLDLRPERCPPVNSPQFQDPGYAGNKGLFLGLFGVTRLTAVAVRPGVSLFGPVWHCFGTVWPLY